MEGRRILLGVTGGIAAYKSADLARRLVEAGAQVQVVMTAGAQRFITPITLQALTGRAVRTDLWDQAAEAAMGHIELARWAELILVAPASADFLAHLAHGLADELLGTLCLASAAPVAVAPAMNQQMWQHPATQANLELLAQRGVRILGPGVGFQACGESGPGRMLEPTDIADLVRQLLPGERPLARRVRNRSGRRLFEPGAHSSSYRSKSPMCPSPVPANPQWRIPPTIPPGYPAERSQSYEWRCFRRCAGKRPG